MSSPDLTPILAELAAGRIDTAEASRRIAEAKRAARTADTATDPTDQTTARRSAGTIEGDDSTGRHEAPEVVDAEIIDEEAEAVTEEEVEAEPNGSTEQPGTGSEDSWSARAQRAESRLRDWGAFARETISRDFLGHRERPAHAESGSGATGPGSTRGVDRVVVRSVGHRIRIVADDRVETVHVVGEHMLRRSGTTVEVITEEASKPFEGFSLLKLPRSLDDVRNLGLGTELVVRVHPGLLVDAEVTAGSLVTEQVRWLGRVRVTAGSARLDGVCQIADALFQTCAATVTGSITQGRSRVRCESGNLTIHLADDSNVTVHTESNVGRVVWAGGHTGAGDEVVMGNGSARLDVGAVVGRAVVHVGTTSQ